MNKKRSLIVRITAIILCALMILGVLTAAISAFAYDASAMPVTGSNSSYIWFAVAGLIAVVAVVICVAGNKKK